MAGDNKALGRFILDGIPAAPRGIPQIEVTFDIDANGILNVRAKDKGTNKEQHITIAGSSGMSKEEVEKLAEEAKKFAAEDAKKKELVEARNMADTLVYQAEKTLGEAGDKVKEEDKKTVEAKIEALKTVLKDTNATKEQFEKATQELSTEIQKVGAALYQQPPTGEQKGEDGKKDDNVVDGEVKDKE